MKPVTTTKVNKAYQDKALENQNIPPSQDDDFLSIHKGIINRLITYIDIVQIILSLLIIGLYFLFCMANTASTNALINPYIIKISPIIALISQSLIILVKFMLNKMIKNLKQL